MKKIEGLEAKVQLLPAAGEDISALKIPTLRDVYLTIVSNARNVNGEKAVRLMKVGMALLVAKDSIDLEDADFDLLKEVVGSPGPYTSIIMGQAYGKLQEIEKRA